MKAELTFSLPDDRNEFEDATNGGHWRSAMEHLFEWARNGAKYDDKPQMEEVKSMIISILEDHNLKMEWQK